MSSRPDLHPHTLLSKADMSATLVTEATIVQKLSLISYACSWSGASGTGEITIEVSNDYTKDAGGTVRNPGTWATLPLSTTGAVSGATGTGNIEISDLAAYAVRLRFAPNSGAAGQLNVVVVGKVS